MGSVSSNPPPPPLPPAPVAVTTKTTSSNTGSSSGNEYASISDSDPTASISHPRNSFGGDEYASISDSDPTVSSDDAILIELNDNEPTSDANHNHWHPQPEESDAGPSTSGSATTTSTTTSSRTAKMSGILLTTSVAVILACYTTYEENTSSKASLSDHYSWLIHVEAAIQSVAILLMMAGMSLPAAAYCVSPLWLQKSGHVLCLAGVALLPAPLLHLPVIWCWIPSLLLVVVLCVALLFVC